MCRMLVVPHVKLLPEILAHNSPLRFLSVVVDTLQFCF